MFLFLNEPIKCVFKQIFKTNISITKDTNVLDWYYKFTIQNMFNIKKVNKLYLKLELYKFSFLKTQLDFSELINLNRVV